MIEKTESYEHLVLEDGSINVKKITRIMEDGIKLAENFHRHVIQPGKSYITENAIAKKIAAVIHTPECINSFNNKINN